MPALLGSTSLFFGWKTGLGCRFQIYNLFSTRLVAGGRTKSKACHCCAVSQVPWLWVGLSQAWVSMCLSFLQCSVLLVSPSEKKEFIYPIRLGPLAAVFGMAGVHWAASGWGCMSLQDALAWPLPMFWLQLLHLFSVPWASHLLCLVLPPAGLKVFSFWSL